MVAATARRQGGSCSPSGREIPALLRQQLVVAIRGSCMAQCSDCQGSAMSGLTAAGAQGSRHGSGAWVARRQGAARRGRPIRSEANAHGILPPLRPWQRRKVQVLPGLWRCVARWRAAFDPACGALGVAAAPCAQCSGWPAAASATAGDPAEATDRAGPASTPACAAAGAAGCARQRRRSRPGASPRHPTAASRANRAPRQFSATDS